MPVTVVLTSSATVAMDTFITELSSVIRNCPDASVSRMALDAAGRDRAGRPLLSHGRHQSTRSALVVGTGVDPVTFRFSGGRSAD